MIAMEELPVEVQQELIARRQEITDWPQMTHATPDQWMRFYALLGDQAREYIVSQLLELAQKGSICLQADHDRIAETSWQQLQGVVELHNARVNEAEAYRQRLLQMETTLRDMGIWGDVCARALQLLDEAAPVAPPLDAGTFPFAAPEFTDRTEPQLPDQPEFLPVEISPGPQPGDRRLYVVRNPEDGD